MEELARKSSYVIRHITDDDWPQVEPMWVALYEFERTQGMLVGLAPDAYQLWVASFRPLLERFAFIFVAEEANSVVGFFAGSLRSLPPYFGGHQVGHFSELFVLASHRRFGIGDALFTAGTNWFRERRIRRIDLPVLAKNTYAREYYLRRGWVEELIQIVWQDEA